MIKIEDHKLPLNPFIYDLKIELLEFKEETYMGTIVEGVKMPTGQMSSNVKLVKSTPFTKLYDITYKNGFISLFSKPGFQLFLYIMYNLESNVDYLKLNPIKICKDLVMKERTFFNAISDLTSNSIVKRMTRKHRDYRYWINPRIMFKGNRHEYMKDRLSENCQVVNTITNRHYIGSVTIT